ncbi:Tumor protein D53 like protein [Pitangus sulphuratus]|nr:Tumor protein D53 like protein [Pitangus sulphuratus]
MLSACGRRLQQQGPWDRELLKIGSAEVFLELCKHSIHWFKNLVVLPDMSIDKVGVVQSGEEKVPGRPKSTFQYLKGTYKRGEERVFTRACSGNGLKMKIKTGLLETQSMHEADEDVVTDVDFTNMISEEEKEELKVELAKLEDEISTLRQVLAAKEKHLVEIKQKLGISLMNELKQNFSKSWHDMQTTSAYKKTHETLSHAGQKATAAISNVGTAISKKFGDMRNSPTFKSFEEKVETTVTSLKTKVGGTSHTGGSFEEVLSSTAHASAQSSLAGTRVPESEEELQC